MDVRLLDLDHVSYLHSQTIYHSVASCATEASDGTIIILRPREPYVCVGYSQNLKKEIDTEYCLKKGIPFLRREVGGGAVYLDRDQLFFQCIFPKDRVPIKVDRIYRMFLKPAVNTYRSLGIDAHYQPVNDIQVDGKKICGSGAGSIGDAAVVVGNIIFDFDYEEMSRVLRLSSEMFREKVCEGMKRYVTTLRRELGDVPDAEKIKNILIKEFEEALSAPLRRGSLTPDERRMLKSVDRRFKDPDWLYEKGGKFDNWVKISTDVKVMEHSYHSPKGLIGVILRLKGDRIDDIVISGNSTFEPQEELRHLEGHLLGLPLKAGPLLKTIESFYSMRAIQSPRARPEDLVRAITGEKD